jgi:hypothetical protein
MAVLAKIVFEDVPRLCDLGRDIPGALDTLIGRMLAKDPKGRPADGAAVAAELAALGTEASIEARAGAPPRGAGLTRAEQRLACIVLARAPRALDPTVETLASAAPRVALDAVEARGGRPAVLADGTIAVTMQGPGLATDKAALAAGCALALRSALPGWAIAMATGRVEVVAERAVGDAIERAARTMEARQRLSGSPPIDLDDATAGLLDLRFAVRTGTLGLELAGEQEVADAARTLLGRPTAFVGRDREVATLEALFAECVGDAAARAVLVTAPAGAGKSRLRHEIVERLRARGGVEVWIARGDPMREGAAFGLLAQLVRHTARLVGGEPVMVQRQKLLARVSRHVAAAECLRVAEFLGELVSTHLPDEGRGQLRAARQDPQLLGDQMRRAWLDFVEAEVSARPLVMVLEDPGSGTSARCRRYGCRSSPGAPASASSATCSASRSRTRW